MKPEQFYDAFQLKELSESEVQRVYRALYREGGRGLIEVALTTCDHLFFWIEAGHHFSDQHLLKFAEKTTFEEIKNYFQNCITFYEPIS